MAELEQESSMQAALAPARDPLPARDRRTWLVAIPLALIVTYAFLPALNNGFVAWDDDQNFLDNPHFRGLGAAQFKWAWTSFWFGAYQPLAWLLYQAQYVICEFDPRGYHLTSLLLQVANALVLYLLTVALLVRCRADSERAVVGGAWWAAGRERENPSAEIGRGPENAWPIALSAGLATALFAVHPLRVEAVAWVSAQMYLPCILFSMLAVLAYLRAFRTISSPHWGWLAGSFLSFVAALLFHALPVSLPVVLLILDVYPLRRFSAGSGRSLAASARSALWEKLPFVMTSLVFMAVAIAAKPQSRIPFQHYDASEGISRACYGTWFYILKTLFPLDLTAFYSPPREVNWLAFPFSVSILATVAMSAGLFVLRRRWPGLLAAWLSYLVILSPNSGIVWISRQIAADRYSYMSMLGSVALAAAGFCLLWRIASRWRPDAPVGLVALGLAVLVGLTALTRNQCATWSNTEVLWTHALAHGGDASLDVHNNLGTVLSHQKRSAEAEVHFAEAIRLDPAFLQAHYNLGLLFAHEGKYEAARARFAEAIRLRPGDPMAYNACAMIMAACPEAKFRDGKGAVQFATRACELTMWENPIILDTLAAAQAEAGDFGAAVSTQRKAIELLSDQRRNDDYHARLTLYQAKRPYRQISPRAARTDSHH